MRIDVHTPLWRRRSPAMRTVLLLATLSLGAPLQATRAQATPPAPPAPPAPAEPANPSPPAPPAPATPDVVSHADALKLGRLTFDRAMTMNLDALLESADPAMGAKEALRPRLEAGLKQMGEQMGQEVVLVGEKVMLVNGNVEYWRTAEFDKLPEMPLVFRVVMAPGGRWRGFTAARPEEAPPGREILP